MKIEKFKVIIFEGLFNKEVEVNFEKHWSEPTEDWGGVHHLEFHGKATSETGYRSHFFFPDELAKLTIEEFIKGLVEEWSKLKVGSIERIKV